MKPTRPLIPVAPLGLTFMCACAGPSGPLLGVWEVTAATYEGEESLENYLYVSTDGDCTYAYALRLAFDGYGYSFLFFLQSERCAGDAELDETYGYGSRAAYTAVGGRSYDIGLGYYSLTCERSGDELDCVVLPEQDLNLRFRKLATSGRPWETIGQDD